MRRICAICFGVLLGGAFMYMGFQYHVVRTKDEFLIVPKKQSSLTDAYVDVRNWTHRDWQEHDTLVRDLAAAGHGKLVSSSVAEDFIDNILGSFREHAPSGAAPLGAGHE